MLSLAQVDIPQKGKREICMNHTTLEKKASTKNGIGRMVFSLLVLLLDIWFLISLFTSLNRYAVWIDGATRLFALILVLAIYGRNQTSSMKTPWIILILVFPILGVGLYLIVGLNSSTWKMKRRYQKINQTLQPLLKAPGQDRAFQKLKEEDPQLAAVSNYLIRRSSYPLYENTEIRYFSQAEKALEALKAALRQAEHFIFMEYFAIEDSTAWQGIQEILEDRVRAGVEVRVFYDDMGSIGFVSTGFRDKLRRAGIQCRVFNPFFPGLNLFLNNRDHRKLTVIDGKVGFTGGYNLADEYFNITHPYGTWKDTGVCITGAAVRSLTLTFLENWNAVRDSRREKYPMEKDLRAWLPAPAPLPDAWGFVQPYADSPMDGEHVGEDVYISLAEKAVDYCWFVTPYLILTDEMIHALGLAARRGVDVRIITPGIPDKKLVYKVTRSYYHSLTRSGVRIYEWTPGFCHCKMCVMDDRAAACGTINLDYRSLYHHFENGCLYMKCGAVLDTKKDFEVLMSESREVTEQYTTGRSAGLRLWQLFLRLFAPLM